ncbi:MAG: DUF308 domain-containing protein [Candidatus Gastranaerophilales bacterium]|nr:DUF308 domain-containing protein [Candidatus Gastranaerophilales bacterium]
MSNIIKHSGDILLSEGIFLIIIGLVMIYLSQTTTIFLAFLLSAGLVFIGIYRIINTIIMRKEIASPFLQIISGLLLLIIGLYLIFHSIFNTLVLTVGAAMYFIFESINSFSFAISERGFKQIFWVSLFTGLVQLLLALTVILGLPYTAIWFLGMLIGINFIFAGITCISEYSYLKNIWNKFQD